MSQPPQPVPVQSPRPPRFTAASSQALLFGRRASSRSDSFRKSERMRRPGVDGRPPTTHSLTTHEHRVGPERRDVLVLAWVFPPEGLHAESHELAHLRNKQNSMFTQYVSGGSLLLFTGRDHCAVESCRLFLLLSFLRDHFCYCRLGGHEVIPTKYCTNGTQPIRSDARSKQALTGFVRAAQLSWTGRDRNDDKREVGMKFATVDSASGYASPFTLELFRQENEQKKYRYSLKKKVDK